MHSCDCTLYACRTIALFVHACSRELFLQWDLLGSWRDVSASCKSKHTSLCICRTPLHKALYLGNLQAAAALLQSGASLDIADHKGRLPLDLLSAELKAQWQAEQGQLSRGHGSRTGGRLVERSCSHGGSVMFSWGNGANLQLGTGECAPPSGT